MHINTICICGAGTMGSGIAQVAATAGCMTVLYEVNEQVLKKAEEKLKNDLAMLVQKGKIDAARKEEILYHLTFTTDMNLCVANLVIEAIVEEKEAKISLLKQLADLNSTDTIFASNTSSLSINHLAQHIPDPGRMAGLHFFNPATLMKLVEIVKGAETKKEVVDSLIHLIHRFQKTPVVCKDAPGFIVNRIARPYYIEALRLVEEGKADFTAIDRLLETQGFKMGPFRLMDLIGNDINYAVSCSVYEQLGQPERLMPSSMQKEKVEAGALGRKTKQGYYQY